MLTITFYSYKGGVGRTLALANVASHLSRFGKTVCIMDFDLEAPGLAYKFQPYIKPEEIQKGLLDIIYDYYQDGLYPEQIIDYCKVIDPAAWNMGRDGYGKIYLLPAGNINSGEYWTHLTRLNWNYLLYDEDRTGVLFFLQLKRKIEEELKADFLLIDSRTGVTESSKLCNAIMPDSIVFLMVNNEENRNGIRLILQAVSKVEKADGAQPPKLHCVLTRIPQSADNDKKKNRNERDLLNDLKDYLNNFPGAPPNFKELQDIMVLHSDRDIEKNEELRLGFDYFDIDKDLAVEYLRLFFRIIPDEVVRPILDEIILKVSKDFFSDKEAAISKLEEVVNKYQYPDALEQLAQFHFLNNSDRLRTLDVLHKLWKLTGRFAPATMTSYIDKFMIWPAVSSVEERFNLEIVESYVEQRPANANDVRARLAEVYEEYGDKDSAREIYESLIKEGTREPALLEKIQAIERGEEPARDSIQDHGILAIMDIVEFTQQHQNLGDRAAKFFLDAFYREIEARFKANGFELVTTALDAVVAFGKDPDRFLKLISDLYVENPIAGSQGFQLRLRTVANSAYYRFIVDKKGRKIGVVSKGATKTFRMEKKARTWEVLVSRSLFDGVHDYLKEMLFESHQEMWPEALKGFEALGDLTILYRLVPPFKDEQTNSLFSDHYRQRREALYDSSKKIPIFGNLYPPLEMDESFINITLETEPPSEDNVCTKGVRSYLDRHKQFVEKRFEINDDDYFRERRTSTWFEEKIEKPVIVEAKTLYERFNKGFILGLPGAGKTTILNHVAAQVFRDNRDANILFVYCRNLKMEVLTERDDAGGQALKSPIYDILFAFTLSFVFPGRSYTTLNSKENSGLLDTVDGIIRAWNENRLTVLIDALDEAPDTDTCNKVINYGLTLMGLISCSVGDDKTKEKGNAVFVTSRFTDFPYVKIVDQPIFHLNPIDMEDMRTLGKRFFGENSVIYKMFDSVIWKEPVIKKVGGTPLMAILLLKYYEHFGHFELRFKTYEIILKFILRKVWDALKPQADGKPLRFYEDYKTLTDFFNEAASADFFKKNPEIEKSYESLSELAYELLFSNKNEILRTFPAETFHGYFSNKEDGERWFEICKREHVLIPSGPTDYVFLHPTILEFLASVHFAKSYDSKEADMKTLCDAQREKLETIPIACGISYDKGSQILGGMKPFFENNEQHSTLPFKCLAEVEAAQRKSLELLVTKRLHDAEINKIQQWKEKIEWVYDQIVSILLKEDETELSEISGKFETVLPLSRDVIVDKISKSFPNGWNDANNNLLVEARENFLKTILEKEVRDKLHKKQTSSYTELNISYPKTESILTCDLKGSPFDKNFSYYKKQIPSLTGFYGSPNFRHSAGVSSVAYSPDGRYVISGSEDGILRLWDVKSGREIRVFEGHKNRVSSVAYSPDGRHIISSCIYDTIRLWEVESGRQINLFENHRKIAHCVVYSPNGLYILSDDSNYNLQLYEIENGHKVMTYEGHYETITSIAYSQDGRYIASGSRDKTVRLWDVTSGREVMTFEGHEDRVNSVAFSPDGRFLISGSSDNTICLWDTENGHKAKTFNGHEHSVNSVAYSPDGYFIISGSRDNTLRLWNVSSNHEIRVFRGHKAEATSVTYSPDALSVVSGSDDQTVRLWDVDSGRDISESMGDKHYISSVAYSPNELYIITTSDDSTLRLIDVESGKEIRTFVGHSGNIRSIVYSPDGRNIVSASSDRTLRLWDMENSLESKVFEGHKHTVYCVAYSPDGQYVISGSGDDTLKLWDVNSGREIRAFKGHGISVTSVAYSPDGKYIISGSWENYPRLWEVESGRMIKAFKGHDNRAYYVDYSPDGRSLVSGSIDDTLRLWDVESGQTIWTFKGHQAPIACVSYLSVGRFVISASYDYTLRLWDVETGKLIETIRLSWIACSIAVSKKHPYKIITANLNCTLTSFDLSMYLSPEKKGVKGT